MQFDHQVQRDNRALQRAAQHPLKSMSKEEEAWLLLQSKEVENAELRRLVFAIQSQLEKEQAEHNATKQKLFQVESACRRLDLTNRVQQEVRDHEATAALRQEPFHIAAKDKRDIRVHGGSGTQNKFAFGSDQLQELIDQHDKMGLRHGRKSSLQAEARHEDEQRVVAQNTQKEHWRRMSTSRAPSQQEQDGNFDIFGNLITKRQVVPQQPNQEPEDIFSGMGSNRRGFERGETDLRADKHWGNATLWRGGQAATQTPTSNQGFFQDN